MVSVALVGPDGAGKTTVSRLLVDADLPFRVRRLYMGVNLEASTLMLPTTRALVALKRSRGGAPDLAPARHGGPSPQPSSGLAAGARSIARLLVWLSEEAFRSLLAAAYQWSGAVVVFDRHFLLDYYHADVQATDRRRGLADRVHGLFLLHVLPQPDLVVYLDAPAHVLHARKDDAPLDWLEARRLDYLELSQVVRRFVRVDASQPVARVAHEVAELITAVRGKTAAS